MNPCEECICLPICITKYKSKDTLYCDPFISLWSSFEFNCMMLRETVWDGSFKNANYSIIKQWWEIQ